jgi:hypothetical protein
MSADPEPLRLTDLVHAVGGWPSDPAAVARVLDGADALLPEGRETYRPLSTEEVAALVLVAGGLDAEPAMALVDLRRSACRVRPVRPCGLGRGDGSACR